MRSKKAFYTLLGVTLAMVAAAVVSQWASRTEPALSHGLHAPDLAPRVDAVRTVELRTAEASLWLERGEAGWVAGSKDGYPADAARIRQLVLGISRLERLDRKTANPDRLHRLELRDIDEPGSKAVRVTLSSADGEVLADILVGNTQDFQQSGRSRYFIRDSGDPQSWLVAGSLPPVLEELSNWLEGALLPGVEEPGLQSVTVTHADGEAVTIRRDAGEETDFRLAGMADDEELDSQYRVNAMAQTLRRLSLEDVHAADAAPEQETATVEALTFNGVRIVVRIGPADPDYTVRLRAAYEPDHDRTDDDSETEAGGRQLARELNERWRGRSFVVSQHALDELLVRRADLVREPEASGSE